MTDAQYIKKVRDRLGITQAQKTFDGMKLHYWAETVEECQQWIKKNAKTLHVDDD